MGFNSGFKGLNSGGDLKVYKSILLLYSFKPLCLF